MTQTDTAILVGILTRILMSYVGVWLANQGVSEGDAVQVIGGALTILVTMAWSYIGRKKLLNTTPPN